MILLRSAAFNAWFFGLTFLVGFCALGVRWFAPHWALATARLWSWLVLAGLRRICGIRVVVTGREHLPSGGPALIASQHQSAFDTLIWLELVPRAAYVYKVELGRVPLFGPLLALAGQIGVDRRAGISALRSLLGGARRAVADGRQIVIFPEGTRAGPGEVLPLQPGVAVISTRLGLPVIPVATDSGLLWRRRGFRKFPGTIHVAIGPPLRVDLSSADLLAELRASWDAAAGNMAASLTGPAT